MSFYEDLALGVFEVVISQQLIRKNRKRAACDALTPCKDTGLREAMQELRRTPDAVTILSAGHAESLGLEPIRTIVFCEAEHSSPIPASAIEEYADLYDMSCGDDEIRIAVAVIERYGRFQFLDLGALRTSLSSIYAKRQRSQ